MWYRDQDRVQVPTNIVLVPKLEQLFIQTDIAQYQTINGKSIPFLYAHDLSENEKNPLRIIPSSIYYVPVVKNCKIDSIEVSFLDGELKEILVKENTLSTALLHLRPKLI